MALPRFTRRLSSVSGPVFALMLAPTLAIGWLPGIARAQLVPDTLMVVSGEPFVMSLRKIAGAGDWNGDGRPEIGVSNGMLNSGFTRFYYGGAYLSPDLSFNLDGAMYAPNAGDVNGDGYGDIVLELSGDGLVYTGNSYGLPADAQVIHFLPPTGLTGSRVPVVGVGNVIGDFRADLVAGSPGYGAGGSQTGRAYVSAGVPGLVMYAQLSPIGENAGDQFGYDVQALGDLNGDGTPDFLVYARYAGGTGRSYVFYGGPTLSETPDLELPGEWQAAGDVNGDGHADLVHATSETGQWRMELLYGGARTDSIVDLVYIGPIDMPASLLSITHLDANGDGYEDLAIGSNVDAIGISPVPGRVTLFLGGATPDTSADLILEGEAPYDEFGYSVAGLGDVDGDGRDDLGVVAPEPYVGQGEGRAFVFAIRGVAVTSVPRTQGPRMAMVAPWPNPASRIVHFALDLPAPAHVTLDVLDAAGRRVARLVDDEPEPAGRFSADLSPRDLRPGVYHEVATVDGARMSRRFVWLGGR